jgi:hypothetical protein
METEWSNKPTLVLALAAPGIGPDLSLLSSLVLVRKAAESLWVPHRVDAPLRIGFVRELPDKIYPFTSNRGEAIALIAGRWNDQPAPPPDPEALGRAAQLIEEVTLRWARQHSGSTGQPWDDRNASRSSQNPG